MVEIAAFYVDAIYYHPAGHKHHFRNVEAKDGKADLRDDDGKTLFVGVPVSTKPEAGFVVLSGQSPAPKKPASK